MINRIVLIGNGFDLAHGLKTSYGNFIDWYLNKRFESFFSDQDFNKLENDGLFSLEYIPASGASSIFENKSKYFDYTPTDLLNKFIRHSYPGLKFSDLFKKILLEYSTRKWVDIECVYFSLLKDIAFYPNKDIADDKIKNLNSSLLSLEKLLIEYLSTLDLPDEANPHFKNIIYDYLKIDDIAICKLDKLYNYLRWIYGLSESKLNEYLSNHTAPKYANNWLTLSDYKERHPNPTNKELNDFPPYIVFPNKVVLVSFNYTNLADVYVANKSIEVIYIHGKLSEPKSVIFGYGDELDYDYSKIQNLNDNSYLNNNKSILYLESSAYRNLLNTIEEAPYQVIILGHSCGISDRTLLNTLFEHPNCISIKPYYYKHEEEDNFRDIIQNISRNFRDKKLMRDLVVNKKYCSKIPQIK